MAGVSAGPDAFFSVKPAELAKPECFAVRRDEIDSLSLSVSIHTPALQTYLRKLRNNPATTNSLRAYVDINPSLDLSELDADTLVSFIPMEAVSEDGIGEYNTQNRHFRDVRTGYTRFADDDILWAKITPSMQNGKSCIATKLTNGVGFGSTEFHVLRVKSSRVSKEFVFEFLSQDTLRNVAIHAFTGSAGQQRVPDAFLENLPFPELSETHQNELVALMDAARAERKAKLAYADALFAGVDDFVLDALGIVPPKDDTSRAFAARLSQMGGEKRLNAEYYHPERTTALSALQATSENLTSSLLMEVVNFEREQLKTPSENYLSLAHVQGNTGELTDATDTASGNCLAFQTDDVLFARLRPYLNKVYRAEMNGCCSTEFHVLRVKDCKSLLPEYLAAILRSRIALAQTVHMMTGNTHPRLTNYDVATLAIPIPSMDIQNVIATEVKRRRNEARRLRAEAEAGWDAAKAGFEARLLGSTQ